MATSERELFDGEPVIKFQKEGDRRNFLKYAKAVGVGGALAFAGVACADDGDTPDTAASPGADDETPAETESSAPAVPQSDLDVLNYALTLEYLEADFYEQGVQENVVKGREMEIVKAVGAHEAAHVGALSQTITDLGGEPVAKPQFKYPDGTFENRDAFLKTASTFEELGVTAYHGQVTEIMTPDILNAAASIAGVESRHAAVLAKMMGGKPFPAPFEKTASMDEVLKAAMPFIES